MNWCSNLATRPTRAKQTTWLHAPLKIKVVYPISCRDVSILCLPTYSTTTSRIKTPWVFPFHHIKTELLQHHFFYCFLLARYPALPHPLLSTSYTIVYLEDDRAASKTPTLLVAVLIPVLHLWTEVRCIAVAAFHFLVLEFYGGSNRTMTTSMSVMDLGLFNSIMKWFVSLTTWYPDLYHYTKNAWLH